VWTGDELAAMKTAWRKTRVAYEHIEGALAPIFPDVDFAIDARYDDYLSELGPTADADPFDGEGVTGMHGI
jgi:iron uptake system component EfeO